MKAKLVIALIAFVVLFFLIGNPTYKIFTQKTFTGTVELCEYMNPGQVLTGKDINDKVFSFSLSVDVDNEFITFTSEDRQFASVKRNDQIKFKVFKYPPWNISKGGTFYGGRLLKKYKAKDYREKAQ